MRGQQDPERVFVDPAFGKLRPQRPLEGARDLLAVEDLDLLDEPVQAQAHRRVADTIGLGQLLERARGQDEPLQESEVLLAQQVDPALCCYGTFQRSAPLKLKSISILLFFLLKSILI